MQRHDLALADLEVDALERVDVAVVGVDVCQAQSVAPSVGGPSPERPVGAASRHVAGAPRYASMTFGSRRTSSGVPSAMLLAMIEHRDAVADAHDHAHVVLDEQDRQAQLRPQPAMSRVICRRLVRGSCRRSARRAAAGSARWRARAPPRGGAGRRRAGCCASDAVAPAQADQRQQLARLGRAPPPLRVAGVAWTADASIRLVRSFDVHAHEHVLERGHVLEQTDVLERSADAGLDHVVGPRALEHSEACEKRLYQGGRIDRQQQRQDEPEGDRADEPDSARPPSTSSATDRSDADERARSPPARTRGTAPASRAPGRAIICRPRNSISPDGRVDDARDDVEERRLAGAVGADEADDRALRDHQVGLAHRDEAAEPLGDVPGAQQGRRRPVDRLGAGALVVSPASQSAHRSCQGCPRIEALRRALDRVTPSRCAAPRRCRLLGNRPSGLRSIIATSAMP